MSEGILANKVVLVTGAGQGIGKAIAVHAAAEGARVVVNDFGTTTRGVRNAADNAAQAVVEEIIAAGGDAVSDRGSVADWDDAQRMVELAVNRYGRIDGVVNNAGIFDMSRFEELEPGDFDRMIKVHLYGTFHVSRAAAPYYRRQNSGNFVHVASTAGLIGMAGAASYCAAKGGILSLSKAIALDMEAFGVRSNCVAPSAASRMSALNEEQTVSGQGGEAAAKLVVRLTDRGVPADVSALFIYLLSDASANVNAQIFGARGHEIFLYSQSRPVRIIRHSERWTIQDIAERMAVLRGAFTPLESLQQVLEWKPV
jgi:NAD(P)-dependent dehydrogenase (short-subunit alcohol dehydrogenase family)